MTRVRAFLGAAAVTLAVLLAGVHRHLNRNRLLTPFEQRLADEMRVDLVHRWDDAVVYVGPFDGHLNTQETHHD